MEGRRRGELGLGGRSPALQHWNYLNLRLGMGDGGFQGEGEGYTLECHHVLHDYACRLPERLR